MEWVGNAKYCFLTQRAIKWAIAEHSGVDEGKWNETDQKNAGSWTEVQRSQKSICTQETIYKVSK